MLKYYSYKSKAGVRSWSFRLFGLYWRGGPLVDFKNLAMALGFSLSLMQLSIYRPGKTLIVIPLLELITGPLMEKVLVIEGTELATQYNGRLYRVWNVRTVGHYRNLGRWFNMTAYVRKEYVVQQDLWRSWPFAFEQWADQPPSIIDIIETAESIRRLQTMDEPREQV